MSNTTTSRNSTDFNPYSLKSRIVSAAICLLGIYLCFNGEYLPDWIPTIWRLVYGITFAVLGGGFFILSVTTGKDDEVSIYSVRKRLNPSFYLSMTLLGLYLWLGNPGWLHPILSNGIGMGLTLFGGLVFIAIVFDLADYFEQKHRR